MNSKKLPVSTEVIECITSVTGNLTLAISVTYFVIQTDALINVNQRLA